MKNLGMTALEMVKLYNECGSFKECARRVGWSIGTWAANWVDEGCEELVKDNNYDQDNKYTDSETSLLNVISSNGPVTQSDIQDIMGLSSGRVSDLLNGRGKEGRGLLCKCKDLIVERGIPKRYHLTSGLSPTVTNNKCSVHVDIEKKNNDNYTQVNNCNWWTTKNTADNWKLQDNETISDKKYQIALISDTHFGSTYQQLSCLNKFVSICKDRGIETLLNAGDIIEGLSARMGHKNERFLHAIDDIEGYCAEVYPSGFRNNYFILGNHCATLGKRMDGYDIGKNLVKDRKDLIYLPENPSLPDVVEVDGGVKVQLFHGMSGCAKTRTGRTMNKSIEMRAMGQEFDIFVGGHCHSSSYIPNYMNKVLIGMPSFQAMTPYLANKGLVSECGGLILSYQVDENKHPINLVPEFIFDKQLDGIKRDDY